MISWIFVLIHGYTNWKKKGVHHSIAPTTQAANREGTNICGETNISKQIRTTIIRGAWPTVVMPKVLVGASMHVIAGLVISLASVAVEVVVHSAVLVILPTLQTLPHVHWVGMIGRTGHYKKNPIKLPVGNTLYAMIKESGKK